MNGKFQGYTTSNTLSWFHLTTSSTSTTMSYTVDANTQTNMREGYITLTQKDSQKQLKIHVTQEAKEIETSYNFYFTEDQSKSKVVMMAYQGGDLDVKITSETVPTGVQVPFTWQWSSPVTPATQVTSTEDGVKITGIPSNTTGYIAEYVLTFTQQTTNEQITLTIKQGTGPAYTNEYKFFFKDKGGDVTDYELGTLTTNSTTHIDIVSCQLQESTWVPRKPLIQNGSDFSAGNVVTIEESADNPKQEGNMYYYGYDIKVGSDIHQGMQNQTITFRQTETPGILRVKFNL